jgi:hypothetical protein
VAKLRAGRALSGETAGKGADRVFSAMEPIRCGFEARRSTKLLVQIGRWITDSEDGSRPSSDLREGLRGDHDCAETDIGKLIILSAERPPRSRTSRRF